MIDYPTFCRLRQLHDEQGLKASQIASALDLDPKTVEKWIAEPNYRPRQPSRRPSKLDGFKGSIAALLERHPYTARQLFQQLQAKGYAGGYTILKEFVREVRPVVTVHLSDAVDRVPLAHDLDHGIRTVLLHEVIGRRVGEVVVHAVVLARLLGADTASARHLSGEFWVG